MKRYSKIYEDACKRQEDEDKSFKEKEIVLSDSSNSKEEYINKDRDCKVSKPKDNFWKDPPLCAQI